LDQSYFPSLGLHWTGLDWTGLDWTGLDRVEIRLTTVDLT
jgi:hypothetical protein